MLYSEHFAAPTNLNSQGKPYDSTLKLILPYEARRRSRQRVSLTDGQDFSYVLPAGTILRHGDCLQCTTGELVTVIAAPERLLEIRADISARPSDYDARKLARAAYHLGNRHVAVEVAEDFLRCQPDHVLAEMLMGLGCTLHEVEEIFDPEVGAYSSGGHRYQGEHAHSHGHHNHDHTHDATAASKVVPRIHTFP